MQFLPYLSPDLDGFHEIPAAGKLLYLVAQIRQAGSLSDLARHAGLGVRNAFKLAGLLKKHNWIRTERVGHKCVPIPIIPRAEDERRARMLRGCYEVSQYKGEFILRALMDVAVVVDGKVFNARPAFLKHPVSGEKLEYDIFIPETMDALELHGFQHFGPTEVFPSKERARQQRANDLIKIGTSVEEGVRVVILTYKDLSLSGLLKRLPEHLPRRPVDRSSRYVRTLESIASKYRVWARDMEKRLEAKRLADQAQVDGQEGWYVVEATEPDSREPR